MYSYIKTVNIRWLLLTLSVVDSRRSACLCSRASFRVAKHLDEQVRFALEIFKVRHRILNGMLIQRKNIFILHSILRIYPEVYWKCIMYLRQAGTVVSACVRFSLGFLLYNRSIKDNPYSTSSRKNTFEVIYRGISSINKVNLVSVSRL